MTSNIPAVKVQGKPSGAVFHRCALQVNPSHYLVFSKFVGNRL